MKRNLILALIVITLAACLVWYSFANRNSADFTNKKLNLIVILIDTLRADRLGAYGYARDTSPELDNFAKQAVVFENAFTVAPWTLPSHVTLFSGLYPTIHGVTTPKGIKISKNTPLLAEILKTHGYKNFAYTGGGYVSKHFGFNRGFERYIRVKNPKGRGKSDFEQVFNKARNILSTLDSKDPYFLFLHSYDVHCPYVPPEPYFSMYKSVDAKEIDPNHCGNSYYNKSDIDIGQAIYLSDRYDGSIRWIDQYIGDFISFLNKRGDLDNTVIIVTSDHGEEFLEHGRIGHEQSLHQELLRIPLIIYAPGMNPIRVKESVSNVDIVATVGDLLNIPINHAHNGASLVPLMQGKSKDSKVGELQFSELDRDVTLRSIISLKSHFIKDLNSKDRYAYDLERDPLEKNNLAQTDLNFTQRHEAYIDEIIQSLKKGEGEKLGELPEDSLEQLKSLGYL